jgi:nitrite reductase/ring-hydroxylating ferredoxin subunit
MNEAIEWFHVGCRADFGDDEVFGANAGSIPVAVYDVDGEVFATHNICTHGLANLSDGYLEDGLIECPLHQGLFNVKTGEAAGAPCVKAIKTFPTRLDGDQISVGIAQGDNNE